MLPSFEAFGVVVSGRNLRGRGIDAWQDKPTVLNFIRYGRIHGSVYSVDMEGSIVNRQGGEGRGSLSDVGETDWAITKRPKRKKREVSRLFL